MEKTTGDYCQVYIDWTAKTSPYIHEDKRRPVECVKRQRIEGTSNRLDVGEWLEHRRMAGASENGWNVGEWLERRRMAGASENGRSAGDRLQHRRMRDKSENVLSDSEENRRIVTKYRRILKHIGDLRPKYRKTSMKIGQS